MAQPGKGGHAPVNTSQPIDGRKASKPSGGQIVAPVHPGGTRGK